MTQTLILVTWIAWLFSSVGIGMAILRCTRFRMTPRSRLLISQWLGLFLLVSIATALNFFTGTGMPFSLAVAMLWLILGLGSVFYFAFRFWPLALSCLRRSAKFSNWSAIVLCAVIVVSSVVMANFATAEPMDYDAGLYRMGLINYSAEFSVIPGLANLHDRFGFNSFLGPLAGFLGTGLWEGEGFRIITGLFILALFGDAIIRTLVPRNRTSGDFYLIIASGFLCWVSLTDSGRWIPSPAVDIIALVLMAIVFGYLADYVTSHGESEWTLVVVVLASSLCAAIRPIAWLLLPLTMLTVALTLRKRLGQAIRRRNLQVVLGLSLCGAILFLGLMLARDVILSGWLLYPASVAPLPVDWRAPDPESARLGITWYARAGENMAEAPRVGWFGDWFRGFLTREELKVGVVLGAAAIVPLLWSNGRLAWRRSWYSALIASIPAAGISLVWFLSAPDIRFNWGGLLGIVALPLSIIMAQKAYPDWAIRAIFVAVLIFGISANLRSGRFDPRGREPEPTTKFFLGHEVSVRLGAPNEVRTFPGSLGDGTPILYPRDGENCYMVFPLCLLPGWGKNVEKRGPSIQDGFRQR